MRYPCKVSAVVWPVLMLLLSSAVWAQDPGEADTVRLTTIAGVITDKIATPVWLFNDEELTSVVIPLLIDGYSGWVRFDSVSYLGSRLADPQILDAREGYVFASDSFRIDSLVLRFAVSSGTILSAGSGKLCDLWFTLLFGGNVGLDSLPVSPYGGLRLTASSQEVIIPQFQPGLIEVACDYTVGDINGDGAVNVGDVVCWQKWYAHGAFCDIIGWDERAPADVDCNRYVDIQDCDMLQDYVFRGGDITCACGGYAPAAYDDPGLPDTVWMGNDTVVVGVPTWIDLGIINDEILSAYSLNITWEGNGLMTFLTAEATDRAISNHFRHGDNIVEFMNDPIALNDLAVGRGAVYHVQFTPNAVGQMAFSLVSWPTGSRSMLLTDAGGSPSRAIIPAFAGGVITIVPYICGDANRDAFINVGDAVYIVNYIFKGGPAPDPIESGDANCDLAVNIGDAVYIINYVFKGGPAPGPCSP